MANASNITAPTQFIETKLEKYAYRRFGKGTSLPLLCLQHLPGPWIIGTQRSPIHLL